jgi:hypothetical protein
VDPHHVDANPDLTYHPDADPDIDFFMRHRIHPDADLDPDPDPRFQKKGSNPCKSAKIGSYPYILASHLQIDADPDPDPAYKF